MQPQLTSHPALQIGAAFAAVGGIISYTLIPNRDRELESEDVKFRAFLEEHGYSTADLGESLEKNLKTTAFKI